MKKIQCLRCGKSFTDDGDYPEVAKRIYCNKCVKELWENEKRKRGENNR